MKFCHCLTTFHTNTCGLLLECSPSPVKSLLWFPSLAPSLHIDVAHDTPLPIVPGDKLPKPWQTVPAGACLLKKQIVRSNGGMGKIQPGMKRVSFGVFRSSQEFVKTAVLAGHPISRETKLLVALDAAVDFLNNNPMHVVARHRLTELERWLDRAKALVEDDCTIRLTRP